MSFIKKILRVVPISFHERAKMHHITEERFNNLKDMMHPMDWFVKLDNEVFRYPEPVVSHNIYSTCILIHVGAERFYLECYSTRDIKVDELISEAQEFLAIETVQVI
jgi:hypothetical protein